MPRPKKDETLQSMIGVQIPTVRRKRIKVQVIGTKVLVLKEMWRDVFGDSEMNDTAKLPRAVEALAACCVDVEGHPCINATAFKGAMIDGIGMAKKRNAKGKAIARVRAVPISSRAMPGTAANSASADSSCVCMPASRA